MRQQQQQHEQCKRLDALRHNDNAERRGLDNREH